MFKITDMKELDGTINTTVEILFQPTRLLKYLMPGILDIKEVRVVDKIDGETRVVDYLHVICPICKKTNMIIVFDAKGVFACNGYVSINPSIPSACFLCSTTSGRIHNLCMECDFYDIFEPKPCNSCPIIGWNVENNGGKQDNE
ncbi:MAG: hypothetical protein ACTSYS_14020 [Promethearchaeota archaeon]